jgi:hypothetical protein
MITQSNLLEGVTTTASARGVFIYIPDSTNPTIYWKLYPNQIPLLDKPEGYLEAMYDGGIQLHCGFLDLPLLPGQFMTTLVSAENASSNATLTFSGSITNADIPLGLNACGSDVDSLFAYMIYGMVFVHVHSAQNYINGELRGRIGNGNADEAFLNLDGSNMVPPVDSPVVGTAQLFMDPNDNNAMGFHVYEKNLVALGMFGNGAHIHCGAPGENGPIVAELLEPDVLRDQEVKALGVVTIGEIVDDSCGATVQELLTSLQDGSAYVVFTSEENPDGEVRGQRVFPKPTTSTTTASAPAVSPTNVDATTTASTATTTTVSSLTPAPTTTTTAVASPTSQATTVTTSTVKSTPAPTTTNAEVGPIVAPSPTTSTTSNGDASAATPPTGTTTVAPKSTAANGGSSGTIGTGLTVRENLWIVFALAMMSALLL